MTSSRGHMLYALLFGAVLLVSATCSSSARAQVTLDSPDVDACATQIQLAWPFLPTPHPIELAGPRPK